MNFVCILFLFHGIFFVHSEEIHPTRIELCPEIKGQDLPQAWRISVENPEIFTVPPYNCPLSESRLEFNLEELNQHPNLGDNSGNFVSKRGKVIRQNTIIPPEEYCIKSSFVQNGFETVILSHCVIPDCKMDGIFCVNMCLNPNWGFDLKELIPKPSDHPQLENWMPPNMITQKYESSIFLPKAYKLPDCDPPNVKAFYTNTDKRPYPYHSNFTRLEIIDSKSEYYGMVHIGRSPTDREEWTTISDPYCVEPVLDSDGGFSGDWAAIVCEIKPKINKNTPRRPQNNPPRLDQRPQMSNNPQNMNIPQRPQISDNHQNIAESEREHHDAPGQEIADNSVRKYCQPPHPPEHEPLEVNYDQINYDYGEHPNQNQPSPAETEEIIKESNDIVYMYATNAFFHGLTALVYLLLWDKLDLYGYLVLAMTAAFASALGMQASIINNEIELYAYWAPESMPCITRAIILNFTIICAFSWLLMISYDFWSQLNSLTTKIARWQPIKLFLAYAFLALGLPLAVITTGRIKDINFRDANHTGMQITCDRLGFPITGGAGYGYSGCYLQESAAGPYLYYIEIGLMAGIWIFMGLTLRHLSEIERKTAKITTLDNELKVYIKVLIIITITTSIEIFSWYNKSTGREWYCTFLRKINTLAGLPIFLVFVWNKDKLDQVVEKWPFLAGLRDRLVGISETIDKVQGFSRISQMVRGKKGAKDGARASDEENPRKMAKEPGLPPSYDEIEMPEKKETFQKVKANQWENRNPKKNTAPPVDEEIHRENEAPSDDEEDPESIEIDKGNNIEHNHRIDSDDEENSPNR